MGMFDTVEFTCPAYGSTIEVQSKAGPCILGRHSSREVPAAIAGDVLGEKVSCTCGKEWVVESHRVVSLVPMFLAPPR